MEHITDTGLLSQKNSGNHFITMVAGLTDSPQLFSIT